MLETTPRQTEDSYTPVKTFSNINAKSFFCPNESVLSFMKLHSLFYDIYTVKKLQNEEKNPISKSRHLVQMHK